jgi:hypothetical protein
MVVTQAIFAGTILLAAWTRGRRALWPDAVLTAAQHTEGCISTGWPH